MPTATADRVEAKIVLRDFGSHPKALAFVKSKAKRRIVRAGRRGGKTTAAGRIAVEAFLRGRRVLYAGPTSDQLAAFWYEVKRSLQEPVDAGLLYKNETDHVVEIPRTRQRIRAKTAYNADTLRGDYADLLILDEWQLMDEEAWEVVGAPMLLDHDGDAVFIYTPPSLRSRSVTKARDPKHAAKMFARAQSDTSGRWETFHFSSHDNPYISETALAEITADMTSVAYRQEILAEDVDEVPGALWKRSLIDQYRVTGLPGDLVRVVVGVDPPGGERTECGIITAGVDERGECYVLDDHSIASTPAVWAGAVKAAYEKHLADRVAGESNFGGQMVEATLRQAAPDLSYKAVHASRGKAVRAEPVVARYEHGLVHHVGYLAGLEQEMCEWVPGDRQSPNRLDALVWAITELMQPPARVQVTANPFY